jgi:hypothetical protein
MCSWRTIPGTSQQQQDCTILPAPRCSFVPNIRDLRTPGKFTDRLTSDLDGIPSALPRTALQSTLVQTSEVPNVDAARAAAARGAKHSDLTTNPAGA